MKKFRNLLSLALIVGLIASFAACTSSDDGKEKVTILYPNWVEAVAYSHLSKVALEEQGYTVELTNLDPGLIFAELSKGYIDGITFTGGDPFFQKNREIVISLMKEIKEKYQKKNTQEKGCMLKLMTCITQHTEKAL